MNNMIDLKTLAADVQFQPAVVGFVIRDNRVLLGERIKVSHDLGHGIIAGYGGRVGDSPKYWSETYEEAMLRELFEESTLLASPNMLCRAGRVRFIYPHKPVGNLDVTVFRITGVTGEPTKTSVMNPHWFRIENLPTSRMWPDNLFWVPNVLRGQEVDAIFVYNQQEQVEQMVVSCRRIHDTAAT